MQTIDEDFSIKRSLAGRCMKCFGLIAVLFIVIGLATIASPHEPVFSIGPETIYQGGLGVEAEFEFEKGDNQRQFGMAYEILYGITGRSAVTLTVPHILKKEENSLSSNGLGEIQIRGKYQLFRENSLGAQDKITAILGIKLPTGNRDKTPSLGTKTIDFLFGMSYGHESRLLYYFATLRYLLRTKKSGFEPGDRFLYDASFGIRPWQREYLEWDLVFLAEFSGELGFKNKQSGQSFANSGGNTIWFGPSFLLSLRNIMFKGGLQFPVLQNLNGSQNEDDLRTVFAIEYHF